MNWPFVDVRWVILIGICLLVFFVVRKHPGWENSIIAMASVAAVMITILFLITDHVVALGGR